MRNLLAKVRPAAVTASAVTFLILLMPKPAAAECELRLEGASAPGAWSSALRELGALVSQLPPESTDCRTIAVAPDATGATIVFTTVAGRTARRRVATPQELEPTVEALLVIGRDPSP